MDIEDAHKLKILSTEEVVAAFMGFFEQEEHSHMCRVMEAVDDLTRK